MKKVKLLSLFLLVAMIFATLTACSSSTSTSQAGSFNKLFDSKYVPQDLTYNKATAVNELENYIIMDMSEEFALFATGSEGALTYKVYSYASQSVIKTLVTDETAVYAVSLCGDLPAFYVTETKVVAETLTYTYTLYDATGTALDTSEEDLGVPISLSDMLVYDSVIYNLDKEGKLVKSEDTIPEYLTVVNFNNSNDKYVYDMGSSYVNVYDKKFVPVSSWSAPSYADDISLYLLDNGNIFVQYVKSLEASATEYDFFEYTEEGNVEKFDLVSLVVSAKNGSEKVIDLTCVVESMWSYSDVKDVALISDAYNDGMKNCAEICPIVNGQIDTSETACDIVLFNDDCSSMKSLKIADQQLATMPTKISKKYFMVDTTYGSAIVKANGDTVYPITNSNITANSEYIIGEKAIYDLESFEVVYDLKEKEAEVITVMSSALFIREGDVEKSYKIIMLRDGATTEICTYDVEKNTGKTFSAIDGIGCYSLYDVKTAEFKYYNLDGTELATSKYALLPTAFSIKYNTMIVCDTENNLGYYAFTLLEEKK